MESNERSAFSMPTDELQALTGSMAAKHFLSQCCLVALLYGDRIVRLGLEARQMHSSGFHCR